MATASLGRESVVSARPKAPTDFIELARVQLETGDVLAAACHLHEAVRRFVRRLCEDNRCVPERSEPYDLVRILLVNGIIDRMCYAQLKQAVKASGRVMRLRSRGTARLNEALRGMQPLVMAATIGGAA